jgi:putative sterol carrier protein
VKSNKEWIQMAEVKELIQKLETAVKADPNFLGGRDAVYQFQFHDDNSVYQLIIHGADGKIVEGEQEAANCTMIFLKEDFEKATEGKLNGTEAFMNGRLKIKGDKGLALKLQTYLSSLKTAK